MKWIVVDTINTETSLNKKYSLQHLNNQIWLLHINNRRE